MLCSGHMLDIWHQYQTVAVVPCPLYRHNVVFRTHAWHMTSMPGSGYCSLPCSMCAHNVVFRTHAWHMTSMSGSSYCSLPCSMHTHVMFSTCAFSAFKTLAIDIKITQKDHWHPVMQKNTKCKVIYTNKSQEMPSGKSPQWLQKYTNLYIFYQPGNHKRIKSNLLFKVCIGVCF